VTSRAACAATGGSDCVVLGDDRVVLALLDDEALDAEPTAAAADAMRAAPATIRPQRQPGGHAEIAALAPARARAGHKHRTAGRRLLRRATSSGV